MLIFNFLASLCSWAGWFESDFVGNSEDRFSRDEAHMMMSRAWNYNASLKLSKT